jgi:hypothetical protein
MKGVVRQLPGKQFSKVMLLLDLEVISRLTTWIARRAKSTRKRHLCICIR